MSDKYTPPPRLIWESVNGALDITTQLCKDLRAEIKELKDKNQLLGDTLNIQAELDRRTRVERQNIKRGLDSRTLQVEQLRKEVARLTAEIINMEVTNKRRIQDECPF
jgi:hypothetical protein